MKTRRTLVTAVAALTAAALLGGCGDGDVRETVGSKGAKGASTINIGPDQHRVRGKKVASIAAKVPAAIRARGTLRIGGSADASPPLGFYATDDKTRIGSEIDLATLVADTLGLKVDFQAVSWENLFVGLDSSKFDGVFSNVTVTEERKQKYDFATYRLDDLAFEAKKGTSWRVRGPEDVAGRTVSVASGTNQEKILLDWSKQNQKAGRKPVDIKYFQKDTDYYLALQSGRIDAYFGPHPTSAYHVASAGQTQVIGRFSGGGEQVQGKIAATTRKGSGLVDAYAAALDHVIEDGSYAKVLERWGLASEAVKKSEINPPGLPTP
ncbi:ABC transporter substrate-binding protein [Streptomyces yatensis]|uniref:ABC transporter substrate-binding protein n=1 Tax=Streptomyces yatensis TaxID=155177 RepID=A0ABN2JFQ9_9ACTN|nr:ABC transporter substrate-binding protein [Streptomyces yatensis]